MLAPIGFGEAESLLYLRLIDHPAATAAELATALALPAEALHEPLSRLVTAGLVSTLPVEPVRYLPAPPELGIDALALRQQERLERLRSQARDLARRMVELPHGHSTGLVEVLHGDQAILQYLIGVQLAARAQVDIVDCPPYLLGSPNDNAEERQALARGVRYRAIYHAPVLDLPGKLDNVLEFIALGEHARVLPGIHLKMIIVDRQVAVVPLQLGPKETKVRLVVRPSLLLDAVITCFDLLWHRATSLGGPPAADGPDESERQLLTMLAAGMKDRAISRALGVTERTVTRRVTALMKRLDAESRFQAALEAGRRGWL